MTLPYKHFYQTLQKQKSCNLNALEELQHLKKECGYEDDYKLLRKLIYKNKNHLKLLSYHVNNLVRKQQVAKVFKILQEVIAKSNNFLLQRRDSGYDSDFEHSKMGFCERVVERITKTLINAGINIGAYTNAHVYEKEETLLHWATRENNINLINFFIELGVDIEIQNKSGATALHIAAINNNPNTVKVLIAKGAKVNVKDNEGNTPLFLAVSCENYEIVKSLLNAGADPSIFCLLGKDLYVETPELQNIKCTPLHLAAFIGNFDLINLLIEYGADINAVCKNKKYSCLHMAVLGVTCYYDEGISEEKEEEYLTVVGSLISKFPNQINTQDYKGSASLHLAVKKHDLSVIKVLSKNNSIDPFIKDNNGKTPLDYAKEDKILQALVPGKYGDHKDSLLHLVVEKGDAETVEYFVKKYQIDVNLQNGLRYTPLNVASALGNVDAIKILLKNGASLHTFGNEGYTPLHSAIAGGHFGAVEYLLTSEGGKKSINTVFDIREKEFDYNHFNLAPIHVAIEYYNHYKKDAERKECLEIIKYLLSYSDLDINIQNFQGETPLHYVIRYIKDDERALTLINELLTAKDINPFIRDCSCKTPFDYAKENNRNQILQALINNKYGPDKDSLLHLAAEEGDVKAIEYLMGKKIFDIDLENCHGRSPLYLALESGNIEVIGVLLNKGAKIDQWEECGRSSLQIAGVKGHLDVVELLLERGADVNARGIDGAAVIHLVVSRYIQLLQDQSDSSIEQSNTLKVIEYLLSYSKLDINSQINQTQFHDYTANKKTILHHLILSDVSAEQQNKKIDLIQKVLGNQKIDPFVKDAENKTPIDYYIEQEKRGYPILDQYAKVQEERNVKIKNHKTRKRFAYALTLFAINSVFAGIYTSLGNIALDISLVLIVNIAALTCCLIINKCVERAIEEKYKNKASDLFENNNKVPSILKEDLMTLPSKGEEQRRE